MITPTYMYRYESGMYILDVHVFSPAGTAETALSLVWVVDLSAPVCEHRSIARTYEARSFRTQEATQNLWSNVGIARQIIPEFQGRIVLVH